MHQFTKGLITGGLVVAAAALLGLAIKVHQEVPQPVCQELLDQVYPEYHPETGVMWAYAAAARHQLQNASPANTLSAINTLTQGLAGQCFSDEMLDQDPGTIFVVHGTKVTDGVWMHPTAGMFVAMEPEGCTMVPVTVGEGALIFCSNSDGLDLYWGCVPFTREVGA